ncbi:hypothetical protein SE17_03430, partial [Kouleothrix aurantiaca]
MTHFQGPGKNDPARSQGWARVLANPASGAQGAAAQLPAIISALESAGVRAVVSFTSADRSPAEQS